MISRKKVISIIAVSFVLMYLFCTLASFYVAKQGAVTDFYNTCERILHQSVDDEYIYNDYDVMDAFKSGLFNNNFSYPAIISVYDTDGNLLAKNGFAVSINGKVYDIDKYFSNEKRIEYEKLIDKYEIISYERILYYVENEDIVPVSISFACSIGEPSEPADDIYVLKICDEDKAKEALAYNATENDNFYSPFNVYYRELEGLKTQVYNASKEISYDMFNDDDYNFMVSRVSKRCNVYGLGFGYENKDKYYNINMLVVNDPYLAVLEYSESFLLTLFYGAIIDLLLMTGAIVIASVIISKKNKLSQAKYSFINAAAHELKTPVAVIENQCECVLENVNPQKNEQYINNIYKESVRMAKLVNSLLQYITLSFNGSIKKESVCLNQIILSQINNYNALAEIKNMNIVFNGEKEIKCRCNGDLITLVTDNFISNAVKYGKENSDIIITLSENRSKFTFSVYNAGCGVEKENIWTLNYGGDDCEAGLSKGVGLAVCAKILELHKFKYGYENKNGGVEFYFIGD